MRRAIVRVPARCGCGLRSQAAASRRRPSPRRSIRITSCPACPAALGTPAAVERHKAGWGWLQAGDLRAAERNFAAALKQSAVVLSGGSRARLRGAGAQEAQGRAAALRSRGGGQSAVRAGARRPRRGAAGAGRGEGGAAEPRCGARRPIRRSRRCARASTCCGSAASSRRSRPRASWRRPASWTRRAARTSRAIETSPDSPFLYRELADVERRAGRWTRRSSTRAGQRRSSRTSRAPTCSSARSTKRRAMRRKPPRRSRAALALQPDEALTSRIDDAARRARRSRRCRPSTAASRRRRRVTRGQLAALFAVQLEPLLSSARATSTRSSSPTRAATGPRRRSWRSRGPA